MPFKPFKQKHSTNEVNEEELAFRFIETGQNQYLAKLYTQCCDRVYSQCLTMVKDPELARDYTQDIFLKLISKLATFKGNCRFSSWLSSVTYNYCLDQCRIYKLRSKREVSIDDYSEFCELTDDDSLVKEEIVELNRLMLALSSLPADERMILRMRYADNLSLVVIAGKFDLTLSATKMRLLRSRNKLRQACLANNKDPRGHNRRFTSDFERERRICS